MKLKFSPDLDYQIQAVNAVADIFDGQQYFCRDKRQIDGCIGNRVDLSAEEILTNVIKVQGRNHLPQSTALPSYDFTIEMETGTGKTYVYLKTIFELNLRYGFTKFIIVVPSVAIKEGVYKSLQVTEEHFQSLYSHVPYEYFVYDAQRVEQIRNFTTSEMIQIMVINIDAFRKGFLDPEKADHTNLIHRTHEQLNGFKPIELIGQTRPVVIIDEPQSVDGTPKAKEAIAALNPLCKLRYSATHREQYTLLYKLDSVAAYERQLVKQIEVATVSIADDHNIAYIKLLNVDNQRSPISAKIELDVLQSGVVQRKVKTVKVGEDLYELSGEREVYRGYIINNISCQQGHEHMDFTSQPDIIRLNESIGGVNPDEIKRLQIRQTIQEHFEKELRLTPRGIKVLSLFFIDKVSNYRYYDEDGQPHKGKYALMFEEEYRQMMENSRYRKIDHEAIKGAPELVKEVHNGYFAIDRKKDARGNRMWKESRGNLPTAADESAYNLIMRDKEKLLSLDSQLRFIFSHSALREGWDNPNVFQICTLNETSSGMKKRQELGRGLRIAVNQQGERVHGFEVNTLTVMANESFEEYARQLQKEFAEDGSHGMEIGHVHIKNANAQQEETAAIDMSAVNGMAVARSAASEKAEAFVDEVIYSNTYKGMTSRMKANQEYPQRLEFDSTQLIEQCVEKIRKQLKVSTPKVTYQKASQVITREGSFMQVKPVSMLLQRQNGGPHDGDSPNKGAMNQSNSGTDYFLPDVIEVIQRETQLTRKTIVEVLLRSNKLEDFRINPQEYIEGVVRIVKDVLRKMK